VRTAGWLLGRLENNLVQRGRGISANAGWLVGGGEVALEETLVETMRGEGEASPDGTGGDMGTGPAAVQHGKNRVQSVNQSRYFHMYIRMSDVSFF
jgi:hypothetical protein